MAAPSRQTHSEDGSMAAAVGELPAEVAAGGLDGSKLSCLPESLVVKLLSVSILAYKPA